MLTARGFSAWITCEGKELREIETVVDETSHKVSCWIGCEVGKAFTVHWRDNGTGIDSAGYIWLDGFICSGRFLYGYGDTSRGALRVDQHAERPFMFSTVEATRNAPSKSDQTNDKSSSNVNKDLGTIVLKIRQIRRTVPNHPPNAPQSPPKPVRRARRSIDEACVGFGKKVVTSRQHTQTWSYEPYDKSSPHTFITFIFRYRTRDFLLDQGIITPSEQITATAPPLLYRVAQEEEESEHEDAGPSGLVQQHTPLSSPRSSGSGSLPAGSLSPALSPRLSSHSPAVAPSPLHFTTAFFSAESAAGPSRTSSPAATSHYRSHVKNYPPTSPGGSNPNKRRRGE